MKANSALAVILHWHEAGQYADCPSEQLLERYVATRDEGAFRAILHRHARHVWAVCRQELTCPGLAEDAFQLTFVTLARKAKTIRQPGSLPGWLDRTARRAAGEIRRKEARQSKRDAMAPVPTAAETTTEATELPATVRTALDALPDLYRLPVVYRYLVGLDAAGVARVMGVPEETGRTRVKRGLELLRTKLAGKGLGLGVGAASLEAALSATGSAVPLRLLDATAAAVGALPVRRGLFAALTAWLTTRRAVVGGLLLAGGVATAFVPGPNPAPGPTSTNTVPVKDPSVRNSPLIALAAALGFTPAAQAQTAPAPVVIAMSGTAAPSGGNYTQVSGEPQVNSAGQVLFSANLSGGTSSSGIFVGHPGAVQPLALVGGASPAGGTFNSVGTPVLNGIGQATFSASLTSGQFGLFVGVPGSLQTVALTDTAAPAGGNYSGFGFGNRRINGAGQVAFYSTLSGGSSTQGLFLGAPGAVQALALGDTPAPDGGSYGGQMRLAGLNASGQVSFDSQLNGGSSTRGVFVGTPGAVQAVALQGNPAPAGGNYASPGDPALNAAGQVVFTSTLAGGSSARGIFMGVPGAVQVVALEGAPAPAGGTYAGSLGFSGFNKINGAGQVAFAALLTGGTSTQGIFMGTPGAVQPVALQGNPAPAGGTFSAFSGGSSLFGASFSLNGSGQVVFMAFLTGSGVTVANDQGLYATSGGGLVKLVREGDQINVATGGGVDLRTVADGGIAFLSPAFTEGGGDRVNFSDTGFTVYRLTFTDGSSGIFRTALVPVPEPGGALTAAAAVTLLAFGRWMGRGF